MSEAQTDRRVAERALQDARAAREHAERTAAKAQATARAAQDAMVAAHVALEAARHAEESARAIVESMPAGGEVVSEEADAPGPTALDGHREATERAHERWSGTG